MPYASATITKRPFAADERVNVAIPRTPIELAQAIDIQITFTQLDLVSLWVAQHDETYTFDNQSKGITVGSGDAKIVRDEGLTKTIEFIPLQTGVVNVDVVALFTDGGMSHKTYQLNVAACSKGLKKFYLNHGSNVLALVLEDKDEDKQRWLEPEVYYTQLDYPIYLSSSSQIKFTVEQPEGDPVVRLDNNGMVHALRAGDAKIFADFDGIKDSVVVTVYTKESAPPGYRRIVETPQSPQ